jgi:hypothetical protein
MQKKKKPRRWSLSTGTIAAVIETISHHWGDAPKCGHYILVVNGGAVYEPILEFLKAHPGEDAAQLEAYLRERVKFREGEDVVVTTDVEAFEDRWLELVEKWGGRSAFEVKEHEGEALYLLVWRD